MKSLYFNKLHSRHKYSFISTFDFEIPHSCAASRISNWFISVTL